MTDLEGDLRRRFARDALDYDPRAVDRVVATATAPHPPRRRRILVLAAAAAVVATSVGVWGVGQYSRDDGSAPAGRPEQPSTTPDPATDGPTTTVAAGRVGLDVPAGWVDHPAYPCSSDDDDRSTLVVSDARVDCGSSLTGGPVTTVRLTDHLPPVKEGYDDEPTCSGTDEPACEWTRYFYGVTVVVTGPDPDTLRTLMTSLRQLPRGRAGVPVVYAGMPLGQAESALERASLVPFVNARSTGDTPGPEVVTSISPLPGTVVRAGTQVDLATTTGNLTTAKDEDPESVTGTWRVSIAGYRNAGSSEDLYDTYRDLDLTLTLRPDGTFDGDDGCNTFEGTYAHRGRDLRFYDIAPPDRSCQRDARLWSRLADIRIVTTDRDQLLLIRDTGAIYLILSPA